MHSIKPAVVLVLIIPVVIFAVQNAGMLTLDFPWWSFEARRAVMLMLVWLAGAATGWAFCAAGRGYDRPLRKIMNRH